MHWRAVAGVVLFILLLLLAGLWLLARGPPARRVGGGARPPKERRAPGRADSEPPRADLEAPRADPPGSRGALLEAAPLPEALLGAGLPPGWWDPFDLEGGAVVPARPGEGLYYGINTRDDSSRATLLTPARLAEVAADTSSRGHAWLVLDSPEGCYAVKAAPEVGARGAKTIKKLDADELVGWLKPRLRGEPPHKMDLDEYLAHLRGLGLTIEAGPRRHAEVRFNLTAVTTEAERQRVRAALEALLEPDFAALDWGPYDASAGAQVRARQREVGGDVVIDLTARTVTAPKIREGTLYSSNPHFRSFVTFHTHPSVRCDGAIYEPPSSADLLFTLEGCAFRSLVWHFVTAPEGTYIIRPGILLATLYAADSKRVSDAMLKAYTSRLECTGGVLHCAEQATAALRDAGFIAFFRRHPCVPLSELPDNSPILNQMRPQEYARGLAGLAELSVSAVAALDWTPAVAACTAPWGLGGGAMWLRAAFVEGAVVPGEAHFFGDPWRLESYPQRPGPLMIFYFNDPSHFPGTIPAAALEASRLNSKDWVWLVFLCETGVRVFRDSPAGVVIAERTFSGQHALGEQ